MGDLIGFEGYLNESTPFEPQEHNALWKTDRQYLDFSIGNTKLSTCEYPRFWNESGGRVLQGANTDDFSKNFDELKGCYDSDFDQVR